MLLGPIPNDRLNNLRGVNKGLSVRLTYRAMSVTRVCDVVSTSQLYSQTPMLQLVFTMHLTHRYPLSVISLCLLCIDRPKCYIGEPVTSQ